MSDEHKLKSKKLKRKMNSPTISPIIERKTIKTDITNKKVVKCNAYVDEEDDNEYTTESEITDYEYEESTDNDENLTPTYQSDTNEGFPEYNDENENNHDDQSMQMEISNEIRCNVNADDGEWQTVSNKRYVKPPPEIFIYTNDAHNLMKQITALSSEKPIFKVKNTHIIFKSKNVADYRTTKTLLNSNNIEYYTHAERSSKLIRFAIKNIHYSTPIDEIKTDLIEQNIGFISVARLQRKLKYEQNNQKKLPANSILLVTTQEYAEKVYNLTEILNQRVLIEPFISTQIVQCFNCQKYGHTSTGCNLKTVCVICTGEHRSNQCPTKNSKEAKCANCKGSHPASYRGCSVHKQIVLTKKITLREKRKLLSKNAEINEKHSEKIIENQQKTAEPSTSKEAANTSTINETTNQQPTANKKTYKEALMKAKPQNKVSPSQIAKNLIKKKQNKEINSQTKNKNINKDISKCENNEDDIKPINNKKTRMNTTPNESTREEKKTQNQRSSQNPRNSAQIATPSTSNYQIQSEERLNQRKTNEDESIDINNDLSAIKDLLQLVKHINLSKIVQIFNKYFQKFKETENLMEKVIILIEALSQISKCL